MLERKQHWAGSSHYWLAEWKNDLIVTDGPFRKEEVHQYVVGQVMSGEQVAMAFDEFERPIFKLIAILGWPKNWHWV